MGPVFLGAGRRVNPNIGPIDDKGIYTGFIELLITPFP
jgi:hypothetical protein